MPRPTNEIKQKDTRGDYAKTYKDKTINENDKGQDGKSCA